LEVEASSATFVALGMRVIVRLIFVFTRSETNKVFFDQYSQFTSILVQLSAIDADLIAFGPIGGSRLGNIDDDLPVCNGRANLAVCRLLDTVGK
jgi:hypothetical protein